MPEIILGVSDFVALFNQTMELAYPFVTITGELANFRVSKNRWVYFDLKDEYASLKFFGTVYQLPGPLEEGMTLAVSGQPRLHPLYGFSINFESLRPVGEGTIRRAFVLLQAKLEAEGLFSEARKRPLPYPPNRIGLITSAEAAAYRDFIKVLNGRWGGVSLELADVAVQGEGSIAQIVQAVEHFNQQARPPEVLVIIRGGGNPDDLAVFNTEQVTRAVAASRIPTLVAIGHERDVSLAELAADKRASTPSNAAELMVPDRRQTLESLINRRLELSRLTDGQLRLKRQELLRQAGFVHDKIVQLLNYQRRRLSGQQQVLMVMSPESVLKRGYVVVRSANARRALKSVRNLEPGQTVSLQFSDGEAPARISPVVTGQS